MLAETVSKPIRNFLSVDGQIILALGTGPLQASEIYGQVDASQPTISKRLGQLIDMGIVTMRHTPDDRRCSIYSLNACTMWRGVDANAAGQAHRLALILESYGAK